MNNSKVHMLSPNHKLVRRVSTNQRKGRKAGDNGDKPRVAINILAWYMHIHSP